MQEDNENKRQGASVKDGNLNIITPSPIIDADLDRQWNICKEEKYITNKVLGNGAINVQYKSKNC